MFRKILVAYDVSKGGKRALSYAVALAKHEGSLITALWVQEPAPSDSDLPGEPEEHAKSGHSCFKRRVKEIEAISTEHDIPITSVTRKGNAAKTIVEYAKEGGFDLIVLGHSEHSRFVGRMLGDIADCVCDLACCNVLLVKN